MFGFSACQLVGYAGEKGRVETRDRYLHTCMYAIEKQDIGAHLECARWPAAT